MASPLSPPASPLPTWPPRNDEGMHALALLLRHSLHRLRHRPGRLENRLEGEAAHTRVAAPVDRHHPFARVGRLRTDTLRREETKTHTG